MKDVLSIHLGQCGIQIAGCFWEELIKCLKSSTDEKCVDLSDAHSFFSCEDVLNTSDYSSDLSNIPVSSLSSRCILVDTEVGAISEILQNRDLNNIDSANVVCGTEPTGGNWSTAYYDLGPQYQSSLEDLVVRHVESCDEGLEYFNTTFAMVGGTGSGLGSYILDMLQEACPKVPRICNVITQDSEAAVSPYNAVLCMKHLNDTGSIANIFSNEALMRCSTGSTAPILRKSRIEGEDSRHGFKNINTLIAEHMIGFNLGTLCKRYPGFRMNSVITTLKPFEVLNLMCPAMVPQHLLNETGLESLANELLRPSNRMSPIPLNINSRPIAMAICGEFDASTFKYVKRLKLKSNMISWMRDAVKLSVAGAFAGPPAATKQRGIYAIVNDSGIAPFLERNVSNFDTLYAKKAFLHHFTGRLEMDELTQARDHVSSLQSHYYEIYNSGMPPHDLLDPYSLNSIGNQLNQVINVSCTDIWNSPPANIQSNKKRWWDLYGRPIV